MPQFLQLCIAISHLVHIATSKPKLFHKGIYSYTHTLICNIIFVLLHTFNWQGHSEVDKRTHQHHHLWQLHGSCKQHSLTYFSLCNSKVNQQFIATPKATIYLAIIPQWLQTITSLLQRGYSHNHTVDTKKVYDPTVATHRINNYTVATNNHIFVTKRLLT